MRITVCVINLSGMNTDCECQDNDSIDTLKDRISFKERISKSEFIITYKGRPIYDLDATLSQNGIQENSTLHMVRISKQEIENQNLFKGWFPDGVLTSLERYPIPSNSGEIFRGALNDLKKLLSTTTLKWTLKSLAIIIDGVQREMDVYDWRRTEANSKQPQEKRVSPVFTKDRREKIITCLKWNYMAFLKKGQAEILKKNIPNADSIKSYEDFLNQFRNPRQEDIKIIEANGQIFLNDSRNNHFEFDSRSWEEIELMRSDTLRKTKTLAKSGTMDLSEELDILDHKSKYLRRIYFRPIHELANGLEKRENLIKTLKIKGELIFSSNLKRLQSIFKKRELEDEFVDFKTILKGLESSHGIECLKFNLKKSENPEQQLNVAEFLLKFSKVDYLMNNLKYLDISGISISSECMRALSSLLKNPTLEHLALNNCNIKKEMKKGKLSQIETIDGKIFENLCAEFAKSNLKSIELQENNLDTEAVIYLVNHLENCSNLKRLDISKNPCSGPCADHIVRLIQNSGLTSLNIADTKILGTRLNNVLIEGLGSSSSLEFIGIEPTLQHEYKPRANIYWNILCCCFCKCKPKWYSSGCCKSLLWCLRMKTDDHEKIDKHQKEIASDINERSANIPKLRQLEINIEEYLTYQSTYQDMMIYIDAVTENENLQRAQRRQDAEEEKIPDDRNGLENPSSSLISSTHQDTPKEVFDKIENFSNDGPEID